MKFDPLTREQLISQKSCCGSGCMNCPYEPRYVKGTTKIK